MERLLFTLQASGWALVCIGSLFLSLHIAGLYSTSADLPLIGNPSAYFETGFVAPASFMLLTGFGVLLLAYSTLGLIDLVRAVKGAD